jgi:hypothetical protein
MYNIDLYCRSHLGKLLVNKCLVKKYNELSNRAIQSYFNTKPNIYRFKVTNLCQSIQSITYCVRYVIKHF